MTDRKFYRTFIQLEVLSETPIGDMTMGDINYGINKGGLSGKYTTVEQDTEVNGKLMAKLLIEQGSHPEFFQLTDDGNDTNDKLVEDFFS